MAQRGISQKGRGGGRLSSSTSSTPSTSNSHSSVNFMSLSAQYTPSHSTRYPKLKLHGLNLRHRCMSRLNLRHRCMSRLNLLHCCMSRLNLLHRRINFPITISHHRMSKQSICLRLINTKIESRWKLYSLCVAVRIF